MIPYASPINNANCIAVCAYPCAFSFSPRPMHCAICTWPPILAIEASPCESHVNIPPTPTPATALAPSSPIHAISVILYNVPRNDDAIIGIASFVNVFKIGPFVKFPSIQSLLIPFPLYFLLHDVLFLYINFSIILYILYLLSLYLCFCIYSFFSIIFGITKYSAIPSATIPKEIICNVEKIPKLPR